jgi:hypothetical protein
MRLIDGRYKGRVDAAKLDQVVEMARLASHYVAGRTDERQNRDHADKAGHRGYQTSNHKRSKKGRLIIAGSRDDRCTKPSNHRQRDKGKHSPVDEQELPSTAPSQRQVTTGAAHGCLLDERRQEGKPYESRRV